MDDSVETAKWLKTLYNLCLEAFPLRHAYISLRLTLAASSSPNVNLTCPVFQDPKNSTNLRSNFHHVQYIHISNG